MTDYAVVVGIAHYPGLIADRVVARDLAGPDRDAQDVYDWLVDPHGGKLDPANVRLLRSAGFVPPDADDPEPAQVRVQREMDWLEEQTRTTPGGRLYLYFSGHGFAPALEEGALFTADATLRRPSHVYVHAWLRWFRRAQRFRETVLWMDCCMNDQRSIPPTDTGLRDEVGTGVPGPAFIALAAQTKSALETTMPDGSVHGVFTWTLLKGLRGGAADERGRISGESLRTFLYNVMPQFLPDSVRAGTAVDLQPFVRADEGMDFGRLPEPPVFPVTLTLPAQAAGQRLRIWADRPYTLALEQTVTGTEWSGSLERGLYVAELPGLRHGFQVTGGGEVAETVTGAGEAVPERPTATRFALHVRTDNPAASVLVTDYAFELIFKDLGELEMRDKPGVYKVRVEFGRDLSLVSERVLLLDRDTELDLGTRAQLATPAPIAASALGPFYATRNQVFATLAGDRSAISVLARYGTDHPDPALPHPMQGLWLVDADGNTVDLRQQCHIDGGDAGGPVAVWEQELSPGPYYLRQILPDGRPIEGSVVACPGWLTQIAVQRVGGPPGEAPPGGIGDVAVFLRAPGDPPGPADQDATIEAARLGLAQGRNLFEDDQGAALRDLLLDTYRDPIAGIIGCHLLLRAAGAAGLGAEAQQRYDAAIRHLRALVGSAHPDVEALSLSAADRTLWTDAPIAQPPLFAESWRLLVQASYDRPDLVPPELAERVQASARLGPFLVWSVDDDVRAAHAELVSEWAGQHPGDGAGPAAGLRLQVPMTVASTPRGDRSPTA